MKKNKKCLFGAIVILLLLTLFLPLTDEAGAAWTIETVDSSGLPYGGSNTSIAIDSSNNVHISFFETTADELKYVTNVTGDWVTLTIDSNLGDFGGKASIAIDSLNKAHISYYDYTSQDLRYATNATGQWVDEMVDSIGNVGSNTDIAIDSSGSVHISYSDYSNFDLKYVTNASGQWAFQTLDSIGQVGDYTSIALDSLNNVHIGYYDRTNSYLKYATNATGQWAIEMVDAIGRVGMDTSIALDSSNNVHISYNAQPSYDLKYATNATGNWAAETVDSIGDVGTSSSLIVDSSDTVHISYYDYTKKNLKYVSGSAGQWAAETVDSVGDVGINSSIAADQFNNIHISYLSRSTNDVKYAAQKYVLTINRSGTGSGSVTSDPAGINCNADCEKLFSGGIIVSLTAVADIESSTFSGWTGSSCSGVGACQVTVGEDTTITAEFTLKNYAVIATAGPNGSITPAGAVSVAHGAEKTFSIIPDTGYYVKDVIVDGNSAGSVTSYTFTNVTGDHSIQATFSVTPYYNLIVTKGGTGQGTVSSSDAGISCDLDCMHAYQENTMVTLTASADAASATFTGWSGGGCSGTEICEVAMSQDSVVSAEFMLKNYTITASAGANGSVTPSGAVSVDHGTGQTITITPYYGYKVQDVIIDGSSAGAAASYTFNNVTDDHIIHVLFIENILTITSAAGDHGTISPTGDITVSYGTDYTYSITPDEGYSVDSLLIDGRSAGSLNSYTFKNISADHTIQAIFAPDNFISEAIWTRTVLDKHENIQMYGSRALSLDSSGNPHIVYGSSNNLYHARFDGSAWQHEVVRTLEDPAEISIAIDSLDNVHISYWNAALGELRHAAFSSGAWQIETVAAVSDLQYGTSIAVDTNDRLHISYYDATNKALMYSSNTSGTWASNTLDQADDAGRYSAIAVDINDKVHISYYAAVGGVLRYMTNAFGSWDMESVAVNGDAQRNTSIDSDSNGRVHISYYDTARKIRYASNSSGSWSSEVIGNADYYHGKTGASIVVDVADHVHISFFSEMLMFPISQSNVVYATNATGSWVTRYLDGFSYFWPAYGAPFILQTNKVSSIAVDASGNVHVGYYGYDSSVRYATNSSGSWVKGNVESSNDTGSYSSLALDSLNNVHISYYDTTHKELRYATNVSGSLVTKVLGSGVGTDTSIVIDSSDNVHIISNDSVAHILNYFTNAAGAWIVTTLPVGGNTGRFTSLAIDSSDKLHVVSGGTYATNSSGQWIAAPIDASGASYPSIAVDSLDNVHISYYRSQSRDLKYATNSSGSWVTEYVDWDGEVGLYSSIAVDSSDKVHITYYEGLSFAPFNIKYATNVSGSWATEIIDRVQYMMDIGKNASLDLDSRDNVHISYYDSQGWKLRYATNESGAWIKSTLDSERKAGSHNSLAIDSRDRVHISYYNLGVSGQLRYVTNAYVFEVVKAGSGTGTVTSSPTGIYCGNTCIVDYEPGTVVTLSASPDASSDFVGWSHGGCGSTGDCTVTVPGNAYTGVTATFNLKSYTLRASAAPNGVIVPSGDVSADYGSDHSFTITPNENYLILDVLVDGQSVGPVTDRSFNNVMSDHVIHAVFKEKEIFTIIVSAVAGGSISPPGETIVYEGDDLTLSITPDTGYYLANVTIDGESAGIITSHTFNSIDANHTVSATFMEIPKYTLTASAGPNGSISPPGDSINFEGSNQIVIISPDINYLIADVLVDGQSVGPVTSHTFQNIRSDHTISASFIEKPQYTLTAGTAVNGAISPSGIMIVGHGSDQAYTMTPDPGYMVNFVLVDGVGVGRVNSYAFNNVESDHEIYASFTPAPQWTTETIESGGKGYFTSIAIDSAGKLHISYFDGVSSKQALKYATNVSGAWVTEAVDSRKESGLYSSIAIDSLGKVHISYSYEHPYDSYSHGLMYVTNASGVWVKSMVNMQSARDTSIALDSLGNVHIIYTSGINSVYYATNASGLWANHYKASGWDSSIGLDSSDTVHISFSSSTGLKYMTNLGLEQDITEIIDSGGLYSSLTIDSSDRVHISYYDSINGDLKYATNVSGLWTTETADSIGVVGRDTSIALDSSEYIHISYYDGTNGNLKYATNAAGLWVTETVDNGGNVGWRTSLVIDISDNAHISYFDVSAAGLKYATNAYTLETILTGNGTGRVASAPAGIECGTGCYGVFSAGSSVTLSSAAYEGSTFRGWSGAGCSGTGDCTITMPSDTHISVIALFDLNRYSVTSTEGVNGRISPSGDVDVYHGSDLTFTMLPNIGYIVDDVVVDGVSKGSLPEYIFSNVTSTHTIYATFVEAPVHSITAGRGPHGSITPSGAISVFQGDSQPIIIMPDTGYHIEQVFIDGVPVGPVTGYTFNNVTADHTIHTTFAINTYRLTVQKSGDGAGTVYGASSGINCGAACLNTYEHGTVVTLTPLPDESSVFTGWSGGGCTDASTCVITMEGNTLVTAMFNSKKYSITASAGPYGIISPAGTIQVSHGTDQTVNFLPNTGYRVANVIVDGQSIGAVTSRTFNNVIADHTVRVWFEWTNSKWRIETVDTGGVGQESSIAVDGSDAVHITYYDHENNTLKYATNESGLWVTEVLDINSSENDIAVDVQGNVHVSYNASGELKYGTRRNGAWEVTVVDNAGFVGRYNSIAVDNATPANVHISYYDSTNNDLKYATNTSGLWIVETVESAGTVGMNTSIAADGIQVKISYVKNLSESGWIGGVVGGTWYSHIEYHVKEATRIDESQWFDFQLAQLGNDTGTSLAIRSGKPQIIYKADILNDRDLYFSEQILGGASGWQTEKVAAASYSDFYALAVGSYGRSHISYHGTQGLKYATKRSGIWETEIVDSNGVTGLFNDIAMGSVTFNYPHISYFNATSGSLKYATMLPPEICTDNDGDAYSPVGGVCGEVDCDDNNYDTNPGSPEICDGRDNNCNDLIDDNDPGVFYSAWYADNDRDTYGGIGNPVQACSQPANYVADNTDCDDGNPSVNPGMAETPYNELDDDCNTSTLDDDVDGDGYLIVEDCDDNDDLIHPAADELCFDGIDNNCDGLTDAADTECINVPTQAGSDVTVSPIDPVTGGAPAIITFATVSAGGITSVTESDIVPFPPAGLMLGIPPTYYDITTTASYTGQIDICIDYTGVSFGDETVLKLYHYGSEFWVDVTSSVDVVNDVICGLVSSLSLFAILEPCDSDRDGDTIFDDGDCSGIAGDNPCVSGSADNCDDNCVNTPNPDQTDIDNNGTGDVCGQLKPYDSDQDWTIGDFELLDAIDAWALGNLGDFDLLDLIDFWAIGCYQWDDVSGMYVAGC